VARELDDTHVVIRVAFTSASSPIRDDAPTSRNADDADAKAMQGGEE
jgi:hypothetical protein